MQCHVQCYAGYRGEETPRCLLLGKRRIDVIGVVDRWLEPDYRYFKIEGSDGATYVLRQERRSERWDLTFDSATTVTRAR